MLIRHISIPRNSIAVPLKTHKQPQHPFEIIDYSDYLTRTLNPEQPDNDVLVSFMLKSPNKLSTALENGRKSTRRSSSVLTGETPHNIGQSTNAPLLRQVEDRDVDQDNQKRWRSNYSLPQRQKVEGFKYNQRTLNNSAYIQTVSRKRDSSLTPMVNKPYLSQNKISNQEQDSGIVNKHAKSSIVNGQIYRTLEKVQTRNSNKQTIERIKPVSQKKYSYQLPADNSTPKIAQNVEEKALKQKKDKLQQKLPTRFTNQNRNMKEFFSDNPLPERKRKVIPFQEDQPSFRQVVAFEKKVQPTYRIRKTSQEQNNIAAKPETEINLNNKHLKFRQSQLTEYVDTPPQKVEISYRTSLSELKEICIKQFDKITVVIKIPEIFSYPMFTGLQEQSHMFRKAEELLSHLQITHKKDMSIKKYNNCILIVANYVAVIWHYTGKVYLGGWKYDMLDDGHKNGLGLEWSPKKFVYYGQFANGKRHGIGIMKSNSNELIAGIWHENKFMRPLKYADIRSRNIYALGEAEQANP